MSKRVRGQNTAGPSKRRRVHRTAVPRRAQPPEPDLVRDVAAALAENHPLSLLSMVSSLLTALDPRCQDPFEKALDGAPSQDELVQTLFEINLPETSALLAAIAELTGNDMLRHRVRREIASRVHALPRWLTDLSRAEPVDRVVEVVHTLGDGDNIMIGVRLPDGQELSFVIYVDHNLGGVVKDAFVVPQPLPELVEHMLSVADDPDITGRDLDPADARARITEGITRGAIIFPPLETETWPACRPLAEWAVGMLPTGGRDYPRPEWDADTLQALTTRFFASPFGAGLDDADHRGLLTSLLWFGTDYGPGDPLRWSPVAVEILLVDWIPRKIAGEAAYLAKAPALLRAFIRFCHHERGIRPALTTQTLQAVDEREPAYQRAIRLPRPQGPAALLAAMAALGSALGALDPDGPWPPLETGASDFPEFMLDTLRRAVGTEDALDRLDAAPLPDEPFTWEPVPPDVHERVAEVLTLVDRCCDELFDAECRTACRRLLAHAAAGDPEIFRRRGRASTAAAAICWIIGKANYLFGPAGMAVKDLVSHFEIGQSSVSQRSKPLLQAVGVNPHQYGDVDLGSPDYLTSSRRKQIIIARDHYRGMTTNIASRCYVPSETALGRDGP